MNEKITIPFIEGDGIGPDIWRATQRILDLAVEKTYGAKKKIEWMKVLAGEEAFKKTKSWLPEETLKAIEKYKVAIKGPLTTPVGGGIRSVNVTLRQQLDLYACIRPIRYFKGAPTPLKEAHKIDFVIFRENTEDLYAGIEWASGTPESKKILDFLEKEMQVRLRKDSAIGIKPMSPFGSKRLMRMAIQYAVDHHRPSVTIVHKGNIMKFTEGAFRHWGYAIAEKEFGDVTITEEELYTDYNGKKPADKIVIKDRIADAMFQAILLKPEEYHVIATPNLNGDYLSDACAAEVGGLGIAPGANIGDKAALFEATHGTAPQLVGIDAANPTSLLLSGVMMLEHLGWEKAGEPILQAVEKAIAQKTVTGDLAQQMTGAKQLKCSEYGEQIIRNLE